MSHDVVVLAIDDSYASPAAVTASSVVQNCSAPVEFVILDLGLSPESKAQISRASMQSKVEFVTVDIDELAGLPSSRMGSFVFPALVFAGLLAPNIVSESVNRILLLDADLLVVADIQPLLKQDLKGAPFGACFDWQFEDAPLQAFGRSVSTRQLNSGVLLIDKSVWVAQGITERVLSYARSTSGLQLPDQDSLNAVASSDWIELDYCWNFQLARTVLDQYFGPPARILHFGGFRKPWLGRAARSHFYYLYREYARRAGVSIAPPAGNPFPVYWESLTE